MRSRLWCFALVAASACRGGLVDPAADPPDPPALEGAGVPALIPPIIGGSDFTRQQVIRYFAPVIYQDIEDHSEADLFTQISFDRNWAGWDNWDNTFSWPKRAYVYGSLIEDQHRYFLHYGLFWPRDWCSGTCTFGLDYHENDMEGLTLVVDKRFVAAGWPYGQIITMETRSHNGLYSYVNCSFDGGRSQYVTGRSVNVVGCIPLEPGWNGTSPSPPRRAAVYVNAQSHAVRAKGSGDYPFAGGDGVVYFPTDRVAEVPASTSTITQTAYTIQWMDSTEARTGTGWSLWTQRLNPVIGGPHSLFRHDGGTSGPHDVYYLKVFECTECPATQAKAPWAIRGSGAAAERAGDWHNHPAFAWANHFQPLPNGTQYYDYTCLTDACRRNHSYVHNVYWDDLRWGTGGGSGGSSCGGCPKFAPGRPAVAAAPRRHPGAEIRWDFDDLRRLAVEGTGTIRAVSLADDEWGYAGGRLGALRVEGRGEVRLVLDAPIDAGRIDRLVLRARRASGRPASVSAEWRAGGAARPDRDQMAAVASERISERRWEILSLKLADLPGWRRAGGEARVTLVIRFDGGASDAMDLDFVILAP